MADPETTAPLTILQPDGEPRGGIVVVQEAFGVNEHLVDIGTRLAAEGWLAVLPHLFHRTGDAILPYDDFQQVMPHMQALTAEQILSDVDDALAALAAAGVPPERTGIIGFCMGGNVALVTATRRDLAAAVTFYGGGVAKGRFGFRPLIEEAPGLRAPWLGLYGDLDQSIPVDDVEALREAAASSGQPTEIVRYADAGHGFNCDRRGDYHAPSADDAWARALAWFDTHLGG
jgi:carboxymethylenebutenolidase